MGGRYGWHIHSSDRDSYSGWCQQQPHAGTRWPHDDTHIHTLDGVGDIEWQ